MPTSPYFPTYYGGYSGEQDLLQDLADEQIKLFGSDIYYLPKTMLQEYTLNDIIYSKYQSQFQVEMILQNVQGFGSPSEFISKFGLRVTDEVTFIVSQRRWTQASSGFTLNVPGRPNEGDLLYFPLTRALYEIKFVEKREPFFQLGKIYFYTMTAEIYELGDDRIDTGVSVIDEIDLTLSPAITITMDAGGTGNFVIGETVTGSVTGYEATVSSWNASTRKLEVFERTGTFITTENLIGSESDASWGVNSFTTLDDTNFEGDQNKYIEDEADDILDFSEKNPFGEYGNITGSF